MKKRLEGDLYLCSSEHLCVCANALHPRFYTDPAKVLTQARGKKEMLASEVHEFIFIRLAQFYFTPELWSPSSSFFGPGSLISSEFPFMHSTKPEHPNEVV